MKIKRNKINILLLLLIMFFCLTPNVYAITFTTASSKTSGLKANNAKCDEFLQYNANGANSNYLKYVVIDNVYRRAYCSNQGKSFTSSSKAYNSLDQGYANAKTCKYWYDGVEYTGDCSSIVGYIISTAESKKTTIKEKWMLAQASVWIYLGVFVPQTNEAAGFNITNTNRAGTQPVQYIWTNNKNPEARAAIEEAWIKYHEEGKSETRNEDVITVTAESPTFYYHVNNTNSCEAGGYYQTKKITITNNTANMIKVSINTNDASPVYICIKGANGTSSCSEDINEKIELAGYQSKEIYLKSYNYIKRDIRLTVIGKYEQGTVNKVTYDSDRWNTESSGTQGMVYLTQSENTASVIHQEVVDLNFTQLPMTRRKCAAELTQNTNSTGSKNTPIGRNKKVVCAGTNKTGTIYKVDNTTVGDDLVYCTCKTINLGNDKYVNITLTQNVAFKYGNINPTKIYSGGGFELSKDGITTDYMNTVVWEYSDYLGDIPYYYNKNNIDDYDARHVESLIDEKVKKMLEDNFEKLEIIFNTYDSNVVNNGNGKEVEYHLNLKENSKDYQIYKHNGQPHTYIIDAQQIILKEAFFNGNGEVFYEKNDNHYVSGGNKYYIPLYFNQTENNKFKFNISSNTNLTLIEGINYYIEADCDIGVEYKMPEIRYRTISVSNPFPKGEQTIPSNWKEWWNSNSFQNRIKNTYKTLDYELDLTKANANIVEDINKRYLYTDWNLINDNGSSKLVNDSKLGFKFKSNIKDSYCPLGKSDYIKNGVTHICEKNK